MIRLRLPFVYTRKAEMNVTYFVSPSHSEEGIKQIFGNIYATSVKMVSKKYNKSVRKMKCSSSE